MAFRSSSNLAGASGTSAAVPVPTGAASGDIAVVGLYMESTATVTPPSGFTSKADLRTSASARGGLVVYWKRLTAADSGTYSFTWTGSTWRGAVCGLWSGRIASGDPFDGTVGTAESTSGVTTLNVSTSPASANGDAVGMWTNFNGGASWTAPTNYTEQQDTNVITLDSRDAVASGTTGSISATSSITDFMKGFLGVLAVASGGSNFTQTPTDAEGLTDSSAFDLGKVLSDAVGVTDSPALSQQKATTDAVGLTDTTTLELAKTVTPTDPVGLTDSLSLTVTLGVVDAEGLTDTSTLSVGKGITDTEGITDSATVDLAGAGSLSPTDTENVTDSFTVAQQKAVVDSANLTDAVTLILTRDLGDTVGVADIAALAVQFARAITDTAALTDAASVALNPTAVIIPDYVTVTPRSYVSTATARTGESTATARDTTSTATARSTE